MAAAKTGKIVNIKKAQFLSGRDMRYPVQKCQESGAKDVWLTERGIVLDITTSLLTSVISLI